VQQVDIKYHVHTFHDCYEVNLEDDVRKLWSEEQMQATNGAKWGHVLWVTCRFL